MFRQKILDQLKRYVEYEINSKDLERWVLSHYQQILNSGEHEAIDLANEINAFFVEAGEDLITQEKLDLEMSNILRREESTVSFQVGEAPERTLGQGQHTVIKRLHVPGQISNVHLTFQVH